MEPPAAVAAGSSVASDMRAFQYSAGVLVLVFLGGCNPGFSDEDIAAVKKTIKAEFEKKPGVTVSEVTMLKENSRKLSGFVKAKFSTIDVIKACSATMDEQGKQYLWKCE